MVKKFQDLDDIIHNYDSTESYKDNSFSETKLSKNIFHILVLRFDHILILCKLGPYSSI